MTAGIKSSKLDSECNVLVNAQAFRGGNMNHKIFRKKYFIDNIQLAGNVQELFDKENLTYVEL
jgi:hypothetical protein